jgi:hypothetical protein
MPVPEVEQGPAGQEEGEVRDLQLALQRMVDAVGVIPLGSTGLYYGFWRQSTGRVELIQQGRILQEAHLLRLADRAVWERWCLEGAGKLDRSYIGNHLVQVCQHLGEISVRWVPTGIASPEAASLALAMAWLVQEPSAGQLAAVLCQHPEWENVGIWKNLLSYEVNCDRAPPSGGDAGVWGEGHDKHLSAWVFRQCGARVSAGLAAEAIGLVASQRERHPVREYLNGLAWDGTPRLDTWLSTCAGVKETPYTRAVGAKTLISAVARAMVPGCKVDTMLVLEGPQGARKSSLIAALVPNRAWLAEDLGAIIGDKDALQGMRGKWIIEMAEMANMRPSKNDKVKQFLSTCEDNYRPSYARNVQIFPRQAIFIGTLNPEGGGYLKDPTGARRFWPVHCGKVDLDRVRAERDQLWAEAVTRHRQGEPFWLDEATEALAKEEQAGRQVENPWEARVIAYLEGTHTTDTRADLRRVRAAPLKEVRIAEIFEACTGCVMTNKDSADGQQIASVLKQQGWVSSRPGVKGKRPTVWHPAVIPDDQ